MRRDLHELNRRSWNAATPAHNRHKGDQAAFLRDGSTLHPEELDLLGPLEGKDLVHLQCNAGQDTLSLAKLGARVTGVDISDEAIRFARQLSADSGIPATFERSDVFDWFDVAQEAAFDLAFASYGAVMWLSDIQAWGRGVEKVLRPGGRVVLVEFHPVAMMFDEKMRFVFAYTRHGVELHDASGVGDYVGLSDGALSRGNVVAEPFVNPNPSVSFDWSIAEIVTALIGAGLRLDVYVEWPYTNGWKPYESMKALPGHRWTLPDGSLEIPMMFGLAATKVAK
jgi:SAM-dependent methyltransferase